MWTTVPNTDKENTFADYLKNVYSLEVANSDNNCIEGENTCDAGF